MNFKCACECSFFYGFYEVAVRSMKIIRFKFSRKYNSRDCSSRNDGEGRTKRISANEESYL